MTDARLAELNACINAAGVTLQFLRNEGLLTEKEHKFYPKGGIAIIEENLMKAFTMVQQELIQRESNVP